MNRWFVFGCAILAVLGIVLVGGNSQTAVSEDVAPAAKAAPDGDAVSFKRSTEARKRTVASLVGVMDQSVHVGRYRQFNGVEEPHPANGP